MISNRERAIEMSQRTPQQEEEYMQMEIDREREEGFRNVSGTGADEVDSYKERNGDEPF